MGLEIKCGNALEIMYGIPEGSIGAIITDPPFHIGNVERATVWASPIMVEFERILRPGGSAVVMGGTQICAAWMIAAEKVGLSWMSELSVLWDTGKSKPHNFGSLYTHILWFSKKGIAHTWNAKRKSIHSNVIVCSKPPINERYTPSQKPVELTTFLTSLLTVEEDVILDPFCGSGSGLVSAAICGREWIGIDEDEEMCKIARKRVKNFEAEEDDVIHFWVNGELEEI
jgi:DNA modification methylase